MNNIHIIIYNILNSPVASISAEFFHCKMKEWEFQKKVGVLTYMIYYLFFLTEKVTIGQIQFQCHKIGKQ